MRRIWFVFLALPAFVMFIALGGVVVMLLWNWLLPALAGWSEIGFWQALGLLALCRILFGGFCLGGSSMTRSRIRSRMAERWGRMSSEERERLRRRFRGYCGPFEPADDEPTAQEGSPEA